MNNYTTAFPDLVAVSNELDKFGLESQAYGAWLDNTSINPSDRECDERWDQYQRAKERVMRVVHRLVPPDPVAEHNLEIENEAREAYADENGVTA